MDSFVKNVGASTKRDKSSARDSITGNGMRCPDCGAESSGDFKFCHRCGHQYDYSVQRPTNYQAPGRRSDSKVGLIIIMVIIAAIVLPIVLSAVLYIMVLGFGGSSEGDSTTPQLNLTRSTVPGGVKFTLSPTTRLTTWDSVGVLFADGLSFANWYPKSDEWVTYGSAGIYSAGPTLVGAVIVWMNITDIDGNGGLNQGDSFTITTGSPYQFSTSTTYTVNLVYLPTGAQMCGISFNF